ncbi:MAG: ABC transporter ATP-binding protein [Deltaproteobacteria bacterium]|nr:ABC transporter ATP-binding protein [Deltaproteobacteria bacterium]
MSIVSVQSAARYYDDGPVRVEALKGVDLRIEAGEFAALMGPSGSGKTTLLNLIGGLDTPTKGNVSVDGQDIGTMDRGARSDLRRDRIGFIFQSYNLVPVLTAQENTEFVMMLQGVPPKERAQRAKETLASVGLAGMEHRRPSELSGGQQQRVAVARAIATRPAVVLADEPTANLDSETKADLIALMRRLNEDQGVTFLFSTHDPEVIAAARRVIRLKDGQIASDETRA